MKSITLTMRKIQDCIYCEENKDTILIWEYMQMLEEYNIPDLYEVTYTLDESGPFLLTTCCPDSKCKYLKLNKQAVCIFPKDWVNHRVRREVRVL